MEELFPAGNQMICPEPIMHENAGALARPPVKCPPCHYSKQKVLLTVILLVHSKYSCSL